MNIVVTTQITPTFTQLGPLCQNSTAPILPGTSNNNITGTLVTGLLSIQQLQVPLLIQLLRHPGQCAGPCYNEYCGDYTDHSNIYSTRSALSI
jgi:hypothetical protein